LWLRGLTLVFDEPKGEVPGSAYYAKGANRHSALNKEDRQPNGRG